MGDERHSDGQGRDSMFQSGAIRKLGLTTSLFHRCFRDIKFSEFDH